MKVQFQCGCQCRYDLHARYRTEYDELDMAIRLFQKYNDEGQVFISSGGSGTSWIYRLAVPVS
jgi:hypothetical protein